MPAYYFHLAIELCTRLGDQYQPPSNLNIFDEQLPTHRYTTWTSYIAPRRSNSSLRGLKSESPESDSDDRRSQGMRPTDWRTSKISVESVDMTPVSGEQSEKLCSQFHVKDQSQQSNASGLATRGRYEPSDPRTTDLGYGVVHLYREKQPAQNLGAATNPTGKQTTSLTVADDRAYIDNECSTLCILAVPSYMTPSDLLGWVGEETRNDVSHFRLIRTGRSNKYMVLMKFRESVQARRWQKAWNGKLFNSTEPENCHVVFVRSIEFQSVDDRKDTSSFPDMSNDPFTPAAKRFSETKSASDQLVKPATALTSKPAPPVLELPTCPVCLERMDETNGLATIFCQHVFHCACLQKWRGSGCPVCRYTQEEAPFKTGAKAASNDCNVCGASENLWICLICGHVGCGRYDEAHAFAHFEHTNHSFAMDISTQHIWDYIGDEYVHRLIQNKADGKLVELPRSRRTGELNATHEELPFDKVESMSQEYTQLLQSQLDSQRTYFEEQVERAVDKASAAGAAAEQAADRAVRAWSRLEALEASNASITRDTIPALERDKERAERKAQKLESTTRQLQREWSEGNVINESLMDRISHLEKQLHEAKIKNSELEEQNRDLSFFISGMEKLKDQGEDVQEGTVSVPDRSQVGAKKSKKKPKKSQA